MQIQTLWNTRFSIYYKTMVRYYSIIAMNVFYSFLIFGGFFVYLLVQFINWLPPYFSTNIIASVIVTFVLFRSKVRTFVQEADIVFLLPIEGKLTYYFRKSLLYSFIIELIKFIIIMVILEFTLVPNIMSAAVVPLLLALIWFNLQMVWFEQWMNTKKQLTIHKTIRLVSSFLILFYLFNGALLIVALLLFVNFLFIKYVFSGRKSGVNWEYLIAAEDRALVKAYRFINFYIDVQHLKRSFSKRLFLTKLLKYFISFRKSASFLYLYSHLFIRYNDFFYLYIRLTIIGVCIAYAFPDYGWLVNSLILFMTGYQLIPLQHEIKESISLFPISNTIIKKSFLDFLTTILGLQLILLNIVILFKGVHLTQLSTVVFEVLFLIWLVKVYISKRVIISRYIR
ncbi:ABC transporter permease [Cytobacillus suaedae]|nr:ABC transporter permease [Cytobacillus suaedae]